MVIKSAFQDAVTPAGSPEGVPIPVALRVACVISVKGVLTHKVGVTEAAKADVGGLTVIVPVALMLPHPPVSGML
jgi:hypothetical protein